MKIKKIKQINSNIKSVYDLYLLVSVQTMDDDDDDDQSIFINIDLLMIRPIVLFF